MESVVKGVQIVLLSEELGWILHMPTSRTTSNSLGNHDMTLRYILDQEDAQGVNEVYANQLSIEMRRL